MTFKIAKNSDPFKKYWWVLLLIFSALGVWISYPSYQSGQIANGGAFGRSLMTVRQSLNSLNGTLDQAPGSPIGAASSGLAADEQGPYKKENIAPEDGLFPHPASAAGAASGALANRGGAGHGRTFADSLAAIAGTAKGSQAAGAPAIPVEDPSLNGSFSDNSGSGSGGDSGASFFGGAPSQNPGSGAGPFGEGQTKTGLEAASNFGASAGLGSSAMDALKAAAQNGMQAAAQTSNAGAVSGLSRSFDASRASGQIGGGGQGNAGVGIGGSGTPLIFKPNPATLGMKQITPPTPSSAASQQNNMGQMMMQMLMMSLPMMLVASMGA